MDAEIQNLLSKARGLPQGTAKVDLFKEAVRLADVANDLDSRFISRLELVEACTFGNRPADQIVAYTWLLNHRDAFGDRLDSSFLWAYKWVLGSVIRVPEFDRTQIEYFFADSRKRYSDYLGNTGPIDGIEVDHLIQCGKFEEAAVLLEKFAHSPRSPLSDCSACDDSGHSRQSFMMGDAELAARSYEAMLAAGKRCAEEPVRSHSRAALHYAVLGRWQEAKTSYLAAAGTMWRNESLIRKCSHFALAFKVLAGEDEEALAIFDTALVAYVDCIAKDAVFCFYLVAHRLMERLLDAGNIELPLKSAWLLPIPPLETGRISTRELSDWLLAEATSIGLAFDARNGAAIFTSYLEKRWPFLLGNPE